MSDLNSQLLVDLGMSIQLIKTQLPVWKVGEIMTSVLGPSCEELTDDYIKCSGQHSMKMGYNYYFSMKVSPPVLPLRY